jgi:hypothetical protein
MLVFTAIENPLKKYKKPALRLKHGWLAPCHIGFRSHQEPWKWTKKSRYSLLSFGNQTAIGTLFNFGVRFGVTSGPQFYNQIGWQDIMDQTI